MSAVLYTHWLILNAIITHEGTNVKGPSDPNRLFSWPFINPRPFQCNWEMNLGCPVTAFYPFSPMVLAFLSPKPAWYLYRKTAFFRKRCYRPQNLSDTVSQTDLNSSSRTDPEVKSRTSSRIRTSSRCLVFSAAAQLRAEWTWSVDPVLMSSMFSYIKSNGRIHKQFPEKTFSREELYSKHFSCENTLLEFLSSWDTYLYFNKHVWYIPSCLSLFFGDCSSPYVTSQ